MDILALHLRKFLSLGVLKNLDVLTLEVNSHRLHVKYTLVEQLRILDICFEMPSKENGLVSAPAH